ncbi:hypothetical protein [Streptomyces azureus]|uniref:hypothetical protein n=1 Tax=Streptomyces azureus TaxID=146537 RepID=UPI000B28C018|nr:hypothetical protein [Streptomyces azureus]
MVTKRLTNLGQRDDLRADVVDLAETPLPTAFPAFGQQPPRGTEERLVLVSPRLACEPSPPPSDALGNRFDTKGGG